MFQYRAMAGHVERLLGIYIILGHFLSLSSVLSLETSAICNKVPGLAPKQRQICRNRPDVLVAVGEGMKLGSSECRYQCRNMRWNCTSVDSEMSMFGYDKLGGIKEASIMYAFTSAGATYAVTKACSLGRLSGCGCDHSKRSGQMTTAGWKWGGCSSDIRYGVKIARKFMDAREVARNVRALMNLHNNRVGRKSVKDNMSLDCKCHGVSGSCSIKTCWRTLPPFRHIGNTLHQLYKSPTLVLPYMDSSSRGPISLVLTDSKPHHQKPKRSHLVFLEKSPNFCDYDTTTGSLGTVGRSCNRSSQEIDGCDLMCCGRGYNTHQLTHVWQCSCKFRWCCRVECARCSQRIELYKCN